MKKTEGILLDFDGVISKNSIKLSLDYLYDFLNTSNSVSYETIKSYFKIANVFQPIPAAKLLFDSIGIHFDINEFLKDFSSFINYKGEDINIDPDFTTFISSCRKNNLKYKIFSFAHKSRIEETKVITATDIIAMSNKSKANINTFIDLKNELNITLKKWIYIDDNPIALEMGKKAGLMTVMMINDVFTIDDYNKYSEFIDYKINNFTEMMKILEF